VNGSLAGCSVCPCGVAARRSTPGTHLNAGLRNEIIGSVIFTMCPPPEGPAPRPAGDGTRSGPSGDGGHAWQLSNGSGAFGADHRAAGVPSSPPFVIGLFARQRVGGGHTDLFHDHSLYHIVPLNNVSLVCNVWFEKCCRAEITFHLF